MFASEEGLWLGPDFGLRDRIRIWPRVGARVRVRVRIRVRVRVRGLG